MSRLSLLLLVGLVPLGACNISTRSPGGNDQVNITADGNGHVSFNLPFAKGAVKVPPDMIAGSHFDIDGVKMIPGGTIHGFNVDAGEKGALVHLAFDAPKSPDEVRAYFLDQFRQRGDDVDQNGKGLTGNTKDGDSFVINVQPSPAGSSGTIVVKSKH